MPQISQELLSKYRSLQDREKRITERKTKLRERLIHLQEQGAQVQPGKLDLKISDKEQVTLSWPKAAQLLDAEMCEWLREQIPPTTITYVQVVEKAQRKVHWPKKKTSFRNW